MQKYEGAEHTHTQKYKGSSVTVLGRVDAQQTYVRIRSSVYG